MPLWVPFAWASWAVIREEEYVELEVLKRRIILLPPFAEGGVMNLAGKHINSSLRLLSLPLPLFWGHLVVPFTIFLK